MNIKQWTALGVVVAILGIFVTIYLSYRSMPAVQVTGNGNATAVGDHAQASLSTIIDPPAVFTSTYTLSPNADNTYLATIKVVADKDYNLPSLLCVSVQSDVESSPAGRVSIRSDGLMTARISQDSSYTCLEQPSSHVTAYFKLESKPSILKVILGTTTPTFK